MKTKILLHGSETSAEHVRSSIYTELEYSLQPQIHLNHLPEEHAADVIQMTGQGNQVPRAGGHQAVQGLMKLPLEISKPKRSQQILAPQIPRTPRSQVDVPRY